MQISRDVVASGVAGGALRRLTECDVVASGVAGDALHSLMSLDACLPAAQQILPDLGSTLGVMRRCRHNFTLRPPLRPRLVRRAVGVGALACGLKINTSKGKTEVVLVNVTGEVRSLVTPAVVTCVEKYTYLGTDPFDSEGQFRQRKGKAWGAIKKLDTFWSSNRSNSQRILRV